MSQNQLPQVLKIALNITSEFLGDLIILFLCKIKKSTI